MVQSVSILFKWFDPQPKHSGIVYFDGICAVCNGFIDFLISKDFNHSLQYAALQGETAKGNLKKELYNNIDSLIFQTDKKIYTRSNAALMALSSIGGFWKFVIWLKLIPRFIRDPIYNIIAKNRYSWFEKRDVCRIPTESEKGKILD
jgi:predicted DCC family thiol-disulfide oxidoreductase YuxK